MRTPQRGSKVAVTCWCGEKVVRIALDRVGIDTDSCGADGCAAPDTQESNNVDS